ENETLGAALYSAGVKTISRSMKYHRRRGFSCFQGRCPNCMAEVNGIPNVRICMVKAFENARVKPQNVYPRLNFDFRSMINQIDFLFPVGFEYRRFKGPKFLWSLCERITRSHAGIGKLPLQVPTEENK